MKIRYLQLIAATALFASLSACEPPPSADGTSVVAKVGGDIISEAELDAGVARLGRLGEADPVQARGKVLDALIEQYLISQAAKSAKLDKAPEVALALRQAQRQVLVESYMERKFKGLSKPTDSEINDYYIRHPELFSARKIYRIQELQLQMASERLPEVAAQLKQSRTLAAFADWLKAQGIEGKAGQAVKPAEQIPPAMLAQLKDMQDGQFTVLATEPERISVLQLQGSQVQPVTLEQARAAIGQLLLSEKRKAVMEAEIKTLRSSGTIEYASGFAPTAPASESEKTSVKP